MLRNLVELALPQPPLPAVPDPCTQLLSDLEARFWSVFENRGVRQVIPKMGVWGRSHQALNAPGCISNPLLADPKNLQNIKKM